VGFILALAGFAVAVAAAESGGPYAQLGSSRAMTFGALIEPSILFVTFTVALFTASDLPYFEAAVVRSSLSQAVHPAHLLAAFAFFLVVLADTGRIPVETHASTLEFGMIDEARTLEHSGPAFALLKWGSAMKQLILYVILINVFVAPWGLAGSRQLGPVLLAIPVFIGKALAIGVIFTVVDNSFSKLRLFKITGVHGGRLPARCARRARPLSGRSLKMVALVGVTPPSTITDAAETVAVLVLLSEFAMLRAALARSQVRLFAFQSLSVAALAYIVAATRHIGELYVLGSLSLLLKVEVVPAIILRVLREAPDDMAASHHDTLRRSPSRRRS
jgi:hypothetical protein